MYSYFWYYKYSFCWGPLLRVDSKSGYKYLCILRANIFNKQFHPLPNQNVFTSLTPCDRKVFSLKAWLLTYRASSSVCFLQQAVGLLFVHSEPHTVLWLDCGAGRFPPGLGMCIGICAVALKLSSSSLIENKKMSLASANYKEEQLIPFLLCVCFYLFIYPFKGKFISDGCNSISSFAIISRVSGFDSGLIIRFSSRNE